MNTETQTQARAKALRAELAELEAVELKQIKELRKAYEGDNEDFITQTVSKFQQMHNELQQLKNYTIKEANALYIRMYQLEDKEPKEVKTFSRVNKEGNMKVTVDMQERFAFTDEAEVHLNTIQEIFKDKFEDRNKGFYKLFEKVMMRNNKGEFDPKLLAKARTEVKALGNEELITEFDKLDDCQTVIGSSLYCRVYVRDEKNKWKDVSLNFSSL